MFFSNRSFKWVRASARNLGAGLCPLGAFGRAAASPQTRQTRCWPSSERTTNPLSRRKRQDSRSLSLVLFPPKPLCWVSAGALLGEVIKLPFCIFSAFQHGGGITTLGVRFMPLKRWTPAGHGGVFAVFMPPRNSPCVGRISPRRAHHATPAPNSAHSGSRAETRRVIRVDGDDVSGSGIIDTIDPFQADQPVTVALAEGHRNAVSP